MNFRTWEEESRNWKSERERFRRQFRDGRQGPVHYRYPAHLAGQFPSFSKWLNERVRILRQEQFPLSNELLELHCPPSHMVMSFRGMWAHGCHYRCIRRGDNPYVSFDYGIAAVTEDSSTLDVGLLKDILLVTYGKLSCVVMRGEWMKSTEQGRAIVRKDRLGFWSVLYDARTTNNDHNPFVFPSRVSQVYFMNDELSPDWKVVLHHEPQARRVTQEKEFADIDSAGEQFPPPIGSGNAFEGSCSNSNHSDSAPVILRANTVPALAPEATLDEEEAFLDDADYEEELELQYVE